MKTNKHEHKKKHNTKTITHKGNNETQRNNNDTHTHILEKQIQTNRRIQHNTT